MRIRTIVQHHLFRNHSFVINRLRLIWILLVLWFEVGLFHWSLKSCRWPDSIWKHQPKRASHVSTSSSYSPAAAKAQIGKGSGAIVAPVHLLIIADTQVLDAHSWPSIPHLIRPLITFAVELNTRKNWRTTVSALNPHAVLFLGDMINGGRYAHSQEEYDSFTDNFHYLFHTSRDIPKYYVVGNHDVGLGRSSTFSHRARERYKRAFNVTDLNQTIRLGNHTLVLLDAPGLVEEDYKRVSEDKVYTPQTPAGKKGKAKAVWTPSKGGTVEFVKRVANEHNASSPLILFSHIPLARPSGANCGPLREGKGSHATIYRGAGPGYQNLLGKATTTWLLEELGPHAIFSADNNDYCEYVHSYFPSASVDGENSLLEGDGETMRKIKETTLKAFSPAAGITYPGFQLLSLWNPNDQLPSDSGVPTFADEACFLPNQTSIYLFGYLLCISLTVLFLFIFYMNKSRPSSYKGYQASASFHYSENAFGDTPTPTQRRVYDMRNDGDDEEDVTPKAILLPSSAGLVARGPSSRSFPYPASPSGLRTPVSAGSSSFPSPSLNPVLLPPDIDEEDHQVFHLDDDDEEKAVRSAGGSWTIQDSSSPSTGPLKSPLNAGWKRGTRSLFGLAGEGSGIGLGIGEMDREREKRLERSSSTGWKDFTTSESLRERLNKRREGLVRLVQKMVIGLGRDTKALILGKPIRTPGTSFVKAFVWDLALIALPACVFFCLVTWYIMN